MEAKDILAHVDHTALKAFTAWEEIDELCQEAVKYKTASVCIPPCYVKAVKEKYGEQLSICTVVGFPLGYSVTQAKIAETKQAVYDGADEIDMVINICDVKNGRFDKVEEEIRLLKQQCGNRILKVIVETCYLDEKEKIALCRAVTNAGADYIKTSTGFGSSGADLADIKLFGKHIGSGVKIKAAGGIRTREEMEAFLKAGCDRIGASLAVSVLGT